MPSAYPKHGLIRIRILDVFIAEKNWLMHPLPKVIYSLLKKWEHGSMASVIGEIVPEHPKQVILNSNIGGRRVVNMLAGEQLPRIC